MNKFATYCMTLFLFMLIAACSNQSQSSGDWASNFVVWNGDLYVVSSETLNVSDIENKIGEVEQFSDDESFTPTKTFSNKYKKGTILYKISHTATNKAIAIEYEGIYYKASNSGAYGK